MSIVCLLWIAAFIGTIISALGRVPLWVAVLLGTIAGMLGCLPLR
jgi:membrane protein DedA with SNARE-associated domain